MGRYEGKLDVRWVSDGRLMELLAAFAFIDKNYKRWDVPIGTRVDGASIPRILWSIVGSPYVGKYRDASVVHDFYCSVRTEPSSATHRMFYEAMLVSGVSPKRALIMYAAVRYAGPKWSDMDIHNARLNADRYSRTQNYYGPGGLPPFETDAYFEYLKQQRKEVELAQQTKVLKDANEEEFCLIVEQIEAGDLDLDGIDEIVRSYPESRFDDFPQHLHRFDDVSPLEEPQ